MVPESMLDALLPLSAITVRFRFTSASNPGFFHQPALTAFIRTLMEGQLAEELRFWIDAPDSGRYAFQPGDSYRLHLFCCAECTALLDTLLDRLRGLPDTLVQVQNTSKQPFARNLAFCDARDFFTAAACETTSQLFQYDSAALAREVEFWRDQPEFVVRCLTPVRFLLPQNRRTHLRGEGRYVRDRGQLRDGLLVTRVLDSFDALLRSRGIRTTAFSSAGFEELDDTLFWLDGSYYDAAGNEHLMGGALGHVRLRVDARADTAPIWPLLVLGQYFGVGQRRSFGWGRYRLETLEGKGTLPPRQPSKTLLQRATALPNLESAYRVICGHHSTSPGDREDADPEWPEVDGIEQPADDAATAFDLERLGELLVAGRYQVPTLQGVVLREPGKVPRPLAVPPVRDRVAQRAVAQVLTLDFRPLMSRNSFGYRRGLSRLNARERIQMLYRQGYRWFYEADIANFFDSVSHALVETRLRSLLTDDPVVELIMAWMAAPVRYRGRTIERPEGLPQGSPLSPLLANLLLDDFDADLEALGMALVRFADDFVIVCKRRERAEAAARRAEQSLAELGLTVNPAKTRIGHFDQGFRFLGYTFMRDLAVESRRPQGGHAGPLTLQSLPPRSWLARLAGREPHVLVAESDGQTGVATPVPAARPAPATRPGNGGPAPDDASPAPASSMEIGASSELGSVLFVTGQGKRLHQRQGRLVVVDPEGDVYDVPWNGLAAIVVLGRHQLTTPCLITAMNQQVPVHFATSSGRYLGALGHNGPGSEGHGLWLRQQARFTEPQAALALAKIVVRARLRNQTEVLRLRARGGDDRMMTALQGLRRCHGQVASAQSLAALNGVEGSGARHYYAGLARQLPAEFGFSGRNRQPPRDPLNALLSLGYTILYAQADTVLRVSGLLPWIGFYHQARGRHAALASDFIETYRHIVERCAMAALARKQFKLDDFYDDANTGCRLTHPALKRYLGLLGQRFSEPLRDADGFQGGLHDHLLRQARSLIAWLHDDNATFKCFEIV